MFLHVIRIDISFLKIKKTGRLYLTVCTINFDIVILGYSDKKILNDQMRELFPEYIFF